MKEEPSHSNSKTRPTPTEQHTLVQKPVFGIGQQLAHIQLRAETSSSAASAEH